MNTELESLELRTKRKENKVKYIDFTGSHHLILFTNLHGFYF